MPLTLEAQNVYTLEVVPKNNTIPAQTCVLSTRAAQQHKDSTAVDEDTLIVSFVAADRTSSVAVPDSVKVDAGKGKGGTIAPGKNGAAFPQGTGANLRGQDVTVSLVDGGYQICKVSIPGTTQADNSSLVFRFGPEVTSANGFAAKNNLGAAVGVRWDLADPARQFAGFGFLLTATLDYTSAVAAHQFQSCRRSQMSRALHPSPSTVVQSCAARKDTVVVNGTAGAPDSVVFDRVLYADSVRASTPAVWRGALTARAEYQPPVFGLRLGAVGSVGVQPDPRGFATAGFTNTISSLHPYWLYGGGIRKVGTDNTEYFALDALYGTVQNYFDVDAVQPALPNQADTVARLASQPIAVGDRLQWQVTMRLRLFKGASIRAYATFNGPTAPVELVPGTAKGPGFPDIVRIAFLLDRDAKDVWDTLVGNKGAKDVGQTSSSTSGTTSSASGDGTTTKP
jgi:hypothetical protein